MIDECLVVEFAVSGNDCPLSELTGAHDNPCAVSATALA